MSVRHLKTTVKQIAVLVKSGVCKDVAAQMNKEDAGRHIDCLIRKRFRHRSSVAIAANKKRLSKIKGHADVTDS